MTFEQMVKKLRDNPGRLTAANPSIDERVVWHNDRLCTCKETVIGPTPVGTFPVTSKAIDSPMWEVHDNG